MDTNEELKLLNWQIITNVVFIIIVIAGIILNYNARLKLTGRKPFWNQEGEKNISIVTRIIIIIIALFIFYLNYKEYELVKNKPEATKNDIEAEQVELWATVLGIIIALMALYAEVHSDAADQLISSTFPEF